MESNQSHTWEENELVQSTPSELTPDDARNYTIVETETRSVKTEWIVIGDQKRRIRRCPKCDKILIYHSKRGYFSAKRKSSMCRSCSMVESGRVPPSRLGCAMPTRSRIAIGESVKKRHATMGHPMLGRHHSKQTISGYRQSRSGNGNAMFGKHHTDETRRKISETRKARKIPGPKISEDGRRRLRLKRIHEIEVDRNNGHQIVPSFNKSACKFFDRVNAELGWNGKYATNGGEYFVADLGYWVDYYEPIRNVIVEWDERQHFNVDGTLKQSDIDRQRQIVEKLGCKFFRYDERHAKLEDFLNELKRND